MRGGGGGGGGGAGAGGGGGGGGGKSFDGIPPERDGYPPVDGKFTKKFLLDYM